PEFIESAKAVANERYGIAFQMHDILDGPVAGKFDGVYGLDVLEHIPQADEGRFVTNMIAPLAEDGVCIIGMPSLESQAYASRFSRLGHVNCKNQNDFKAFMKTYFRNVFMFSMNDEVIHTGFDKMSHYNIALCCGKKLAASADRE
ncbi:MAG: SAM-dependent methyltransferase, partial [Planctomycetes bacterium]|nr:SAM-dependent methyltransferase [Planctomycetota bacterium]